ncbi:MAG: SRPBCC family protein [Solirubrobacterales bacterium]
MQIEGSHQLPAPRSEVWSALHDPQVLANALPGLRALEATGEDQYAMTIEFGVGSVRGLYEGSFALTDERELEVCTVRADASGAPGMVEAVAEVRLEDLNGSGTRLRYSANANVAGAVAGVGQRLMTASAKRTTDRFIEGLQRELSAPQDRDHEVPGSTEPRAEVFTPAHGEHRRMPGPSGIVVGVVLGFALALIGIAVGRWTAPRR